MAGTGLYVDPSSAREWVKGCLSLGKIVRQDSQGNDREKGEYGTPIEDHVGEREKRKTRAYKKVKKQKGFTQPNSQLLRKALFAEEGRKSTEKVNENKLLQGPRCRTPFAEGEETLPKGTVEVIKRGEIGGQNWLVFGKHKKFLVTE